MACRCSGAETGHVSQSQHFAIALRTPEPLDARDEACIVQETDVDNACITLALPVGTEEVELS